MFVYSPPYEEERLSSRGPRDLPDQWTNEPIAAKRDPLLGFEFDVGRKASFL